MHVCMYRSSRSARPPEPRRRELRSSQDVACSLPRPRSTQCLASPPPSTTCPRIAIACQRRPLRRPAGFSYMRQPHQRSIHDRGTRAALARRCVPQIEALHDGDKNPPSHTTSGPGDPTRGPAARQTAPGDEVRPCLSPWQTREGTIATSMRSRQRDARLASPRRLAARSRATPTDALPATGRGEPPVVGPQARSPAAGDCVAGKAVAVQRKSPGTARPAGQRPQSMRRPRWSKTTASSVLAAAPGLMSSYTWRVSAGEISTRVAENSVNPAHEGR